MSNLTTFQQSILQGISDQLPNPKPYDPVISHAPKRVIEGVLSKEEKKLAVRNALRYFDKKHHALLAPEFFEELETYGRIYMYRFRPDYNMHSRPISEYPAKCQHAAAIMLMIQNNLDPTVAKHPHELITYGGNGAVFQNWAQYLLTMQYLSQMTDEQTLAMYSGHPMGIFPSHRDAPRVVITNGMMIPNYSKKEDWNKYNALGVTQYGQMTAGSFMYIGPQGIVHGTTITLLNAGRLLASPPPPPKEGERRLGTSQINTGSNSPSFGGGWGEANLRGKIFVTSGLGGMSGAQAKAAVITGAVGVLAEVDEKTIEQRIVDGYVLRENVYADLNLLLDRIEDCRRNRTPIALIYAGNVVDLLEKLVQTNTQVELLSDQTSLHNIDDLGYCPASVSFEQAKALLGSDKLGFMVEVRKTLVRHANAVNTLAERGSYFWDYGNAFLLEAGKAGADVFKDKSTGTYKYPSYVEDIMGPMCFDYGFGPFRWVCCSGEKSDLDKTDAIAAGVLEEIKATAPAEIQGQLNDNIIWINNADRDIPIVGSKSRILYADAEGRVKIAHAFNNAIASGELAGPVVLGRDHHDVSGTDSPYRETSNIYDGSRFTADMAVQNVIGDSFRGATWVSLHNGGGVGWGEVINGGFGMVLDGTADAARRLESMLFWDVNNGLARRSWARNEEAMFAIKREMERTPGLVVTLPNLVEDGLLDGLNG